MAILSRVGSVVFVFVHLFRAYIGVRKTDFTDDLIEEEEDEDDLIATVQDSGKLSKEEHNLSTGVLKRDTLISGNRSNGSAPPPLVATAAAQEVTMRVQVKAGSPTSFLSELSDVAFRLRSASEPLLANPKSFVFICSLFGLVLILLQWCLFFGEEANVAFLPQSPLHATEEVTDRGTIQYTPQIEDKSEAYLSCKLFKLNEDMFDEPHDQRNWRQREVWIGQTGVVYYYSRRHARVSMFFNGVSVDKLLVQRLPAENTCYPYCISVEQMPSDNPEEDPNPTYFGSEDEEPLLNFLEAVNHFSQALTR